MTKWLNFTVLIFIVSGCSFQGLIYRNLDWIATRRINQQFDLTREQRRIFEPDIRKLVNEVKVIAVNGGVEFLSELHEVTSDHDLTEAEFLKLEQKMPILFQQIMGLIAADSARLLSSLSPQQIEHFQSKLHETNNWLENLAEANEKSFPRELNKALEKSMERYASWLGELTEQQAIMIRQFWPDSAEEAKVWRENRQKQQAAFVGFVNESNETQIRLAFLEWGENPLWLKGRADITEGNRSFRDFILQLRPTFTPEQVEHLHNRVSQILSDAKSLQQ